jgi:hypothetical protein
MLDERMSLKQFACKDLGVGLSLHEDGLSDLGCKREEGPSLKPSNEGDGERSDNLNLYSAGERTKLPAMILNGDICRSTYRHST